MGFEFLDRTRKTSVITGLVLLPVFGLYLDWATAAAFAIGCAWSLVNLHVLRLLIVGVASETPSKRRLTLCRPLAQPRPIRRAQQANSRAAALP